MNEPTEDWEWKEIKRLLSRKKEIERQMTRLEAEMNYITIQLTNKTVSYKEQNGQ